MESEIGKELDAYKTAWSAARQAAAAAVSGWAERSQDELAGAIARACAVDQNYESLSEEFEDVADLLLEGHVADDLAASDEHRLLRSAIRAFALEKVKPRAQEIHRRDTDIPQDIISGISSLGLFGISIPEAYGGTLAAEPDYVAMLIGTEELSAASLAVAGSLMTRPEILVRALLSAGTEQQKARWLPRIARGEELVAVAVTEPDYGSDVAGLRCRASRDTQGSWVINGTKLWCTFAGRAHLLTVLCRTGPEPGHRGLSLFVAEKPSSLGRSFEHRQEGGGVLRGRSIPTLGYRGMHTFELVFQDYRLPPDALLGPEGRGFYLQMNGFSVGRLQTAGRAVGVMQAAVNDALTYSTQRAVFGKTVSSYEVSRALLGRMAARLHASRQLSYDAAQVLDTDRGNVRAALAKLYAARMAEYVTRDAMQLFGGMGYAEETDVSRYFVDARVLTIFEGTEEVLALRVIANALERGSAA